MDLEFNSLPGYANCLFKSAVKPTQLDTTFLKRECYDLWIVMNKLFGNIVTAHCECKGGDGGACRHIAATLYEIKSCEISSCTTSHTAPLPVPVRMLDVTSDSFISSKATAFKPHADVYDPRLQEFCLKVDSLEKNEIGMDIIGIFSELSSLGFAFTLSIFEKAKSLY